MNNLLARELVVGNLHRRKARDATGELGAVLIANAHDLVFREVPFAAGDAGREQAAALLS